MALSDMAMVGPGSFAGSVLLMIAIAIGLIAAIITYMNSRRLKGEVFEAPMIHLSIGMLFVTLSLIDVTFFGYFLGAASVKVIHDVSFIIGLGLMLFSSVKITRFLTGVESFAHKLTEEPVDLMPVEEKPASSAKKKKSAKTSKANKKKASKSSKSKKKK
ncbi:hypothetical protein GF345_04540 [Candidatus Woesearchaeota archaeon]|nr:hypothetical protein [Candidatus Woesearchaeota archaeon]